MVRAKDSHLKGCRFEFHRNEHVGRERGREEEARPEPAGGRACAREQLAEAACQQHHLSTAAAKTVSSTGGRAESGSNDNPKL